MRHDGWTIAEDKQNGYPKGCEWVVLEAKRRALPIGLLCFIQM